MFLGYSPLPVLSKVVSAIWFQDIVDLAFEVSGKSLPHSLVSTKHMLICSYAFQQFAADSLLHPGNVVSLFPTYLVAQLVSLLHMPLSTD